MSKNEQNKSPFDLKVARCRAKNLPDLIENAAWDHAVTLFKELLGAAAENEEMVRVVSGTLNSQFYNELSDELDACIKAGVNIELIVLDGDADLVGNVFAEKIEAYENGEAFKVAKANKISAAHMLLIGDGRRFRLETDHEQTKAIASFNNGSMGESLLSIYNATKAKVVELAGRPLLHSI